MRPIPLDTLLATPLQGAVRAQSLAARETLDYVEKIGLEGDRVRTVTFRADRIVEETSIDPQSGKFRSQFVERPFDITVPLLALAPPPSMSLGEMELDFGVDIIEAISETFGSKRMPDKSASLASSLAVFTPQARADAGTWRVKMKIRQQEPEGLGRFGDVLIELLSGRPRSGTKKKKAELRLEDIPGVDAPLVTTLRGAGVNTVVELLAADDARVTELARATGMSERRLRYAIEGARMVSEEATG